MITFNSFSKDPYLIRHINGILRHVFFALTLLGVEMVFAQNRSGDKSALIAKDSSENRKDTRNVIFSAKNIEKVGLFNWVQDSNAVKSDSNYIEEEFSELEGGLEWGEMNKVDLSKEIDQLDNIHLKEDHYRPVKEENLNFDSKVNSLGDQKVGEKWQNSELSHARIFDDYPREIYRDKMSLKQHLKDLDEISKEKSSLMKDSEMDKSVLNDYHKYLKGQKSTEEFERSIKASKARQSNKSDRKAHKKLLKKVKHLESQEQRVKEELKENKYIQHLQKDEGDSIGSLKSIDDTGEWNEALDYNQLNAQLEKDDISALLSNDELSSHLNEQQPDFGKVGVEVIKKEALQVLDSLSGNKQNDLIKGAKHAKRTNKKEVSELLVKDSHQRKLMPNNTYFEGIMAFSQDFSSFSLSPNVGYEFRNGFSVGLGLTFHHTRDSSALIRTALDYKTFAKYELLEGLFFVQTEYVAMVPGISYLDVKEGVDDSKRSGVLIGGGVTIKIRGKNILGLGIMYNLNQSMGVPTYDSPILVRLGIKPF